MSLEIAVVTFINAIKGVNIIIVRLPTESVGVGGLFDKLAFFLSDKGVEIFSFLKIGFFYAPKVFAIVVDDLSSLVGDTGQQLIGLGSVEKILFNEKCINHERTPHLVGSM